MATDNNTQSVSSAYPAFMEKLGDLFNPILVKEVRRSIKSREFVITFMLLIIISWLISIIGMLSKGATIEYGSPSREFFIGYFWCLCFAFMVIVPFSAYRSLVSEQEHQTLEILNITTLSPRNIVWGKLLTAVVQMFLFYCVVAPFVSFTSLLQGFDFSLFFYLLYLAGYISILLTMISLAVTFNVRYRMWKNLMVGIMLIGLLFNYFCMISMLSSLFFFGSIEYNIEFLIINLCIIFFGIAFFFLFEQITISNLTFESDDKTSGIRLSHIAIYLFGAIIVFTNILFYASSFGNELFFYFAMSGILIYYNLGYFSLGKDDFLSRRIRIQLTKNNYLLRFFKSFLLPGSSRAYLLTVSGLLINLFLAHIAINSQEYLNTLIITVGYALIYLGVHYRLMLFMNSVSPETKPIHGKVIMILLLAIGMIFPVIIGWVKSELYRSWDYNFSYWTITNPFSTVTYVAQKNQEAIDFVNLIFFTGLFIFILNLRPVLKSIFDVINPHLDGPAIKKIDTASDVRGMAVD